MTFAGSTTSPEKSANEWKLISHTEDKSAEMWNTSTVIYGIKRHTEGKYELQFSLIKNPLTLFPLHNIPPLRRESDVNVTMAYMEGNNKCLCSNSQRED